MPKAKFFVSEATDILYDQQFDVLVSNGVFMYLPTLDYAATVLLRMLTMANRNVGIFDIPDIAKKEADINRRKARGYISFLRFDPVVRYGTGCLNTGKDLENQG
ncbi:hypothetical protein BJP34_10325 [Moorena producens PAL-8-15-08-1]|uniref:CheR-type methyltransferase domain-containing protein n=1 Tax=Moorena producens PAL-8-15-08-1 TaxID=1458985 RepID=A0A1D8TQB8_9CYAN|nr:class I SAM-dependent methyltransferase [Moorena producens]AOW99796.1 hypothetical protein BJP34_10325 [Moorena producens PAL-8-15-08-1]